MRPPCQTCAVICTCCSLAAVLGLPCQYDCPRHSWRGIDSCLPCELAILLLQVGGTLMSWLLLALQVG